MLGPGGGAFILIAIGALFALIACPIAGLGLFLRLRKATHGVTGARRGLVLAWTAFFPFQVVVLLVLAGVGYDQTLDRRHVGSGRAPLPATSAELRYDPSGYDAKGHVVYDTWLSGYPPPIEPDSGLATFGRADPIVYGQWKVSRQYFIWDLRTPRMDRFADEAALDHAAQALGIEKPTLDDAEHAYDHARQAWIDGLTIGAELAIVALFVLAWRRQTKALRAAAS